MSGLAGKLLGCGTERSIALAFLLLPGLLSARRVSAQDLPRHHVLVISVDGMRPGDYLSPPPGSHIPNLLRLKSHGSFAEAVRGVYPSVTYPSHTTIVTGYLPAQDGVYTNYSSRVAGKNPNDWFWFAKAIRCTTLWDEARKDNLTTASITWPVTADAAIDWDVPEIWNQSKPPVPEPLYIAKFMNPVFALETFAALGVPKPGADPEGNDWVTGPSESRRRPQGAAGSRCSARRNVRFSSRRRARQ
jgi:predicted AlkP superfamily pyrophosphatase or phosphodiesterase